MKRVDVLCVGHAAYDVTLVVDHHPGEDEKCPASQRSMAGGGPAANASVAVARLGGLAALCGYMGRDLFGDLHLAELRAEGVLTDWIVRGPHPTPLSMVLVKPGGKRTVVNFREETPRLDPRQVDLSRLAPRVLLMDGHEPDLSLALIREAVRRRIPTVLDAGSVQSGAGRLAGHVDHLIASSRFARELTGENDMQRALRSLSTLAPVAAVTLGEEGFIWSHEGREEHWTAIPVEVVVDTTGAGDVFHGAYALEIARGASLDAAFRTARAAAALACTGLGARPPIPDRTALEKWQAG
jgi:sulfofructose kinase